jgi:hypothetical protein
MAALLGVGWLGVLLAARQSRPSGRPDPARLAG